MHLSSRSSAGLQEARVDVVQLEPLLQPRLGTRPHQGCVEAWADPQVLEAHVSALLARDLTDLHDDAAPGRLMLGQDDHDMQALNEPLGNESVVHIRLGGQQVHAEFLQRFAGGFGMDGAEAAARA